MNERALRRMAGALTLALLFPPREAAAFVSNAGGSAAQFLQLGAGARALGMGEAYSAVAEGAEAIYWNPAGLAQIVRPEASYSHVEMLRSIHQDFLAYAHPLGQGTLGASVNLFYQDSQDLVTNTNQVAGRFTTHSEAYTLAYAHGISVGEDYHAEDRDYFAQAWNLPGSYHPLERDKELWNGSLLLGAALKAVTESIYNRSAGAFAADGGVLFRPAEMPQLSLSFDFRNVGTQERFIAESESLPTQLDFGIAYNARWTDHRLIPAFEIALPYYGAPYGKVGLEYSFAAGENVTAAARVGYKTLSAPDLSPLSGLTGGIGLRFKRLTTDFAFQPMSDLGEIYRLSLGWRF